MAAVATKRKTSKEYPMTHSLVTGAGHRLGRAMALYLAQRGHDVAVHYSTSEIAANKVVADIKAMGRNAVALQADLLDEVQAQALLPRACDQLGGPIYCLVNNASIFEHDTVNSATRASWDRHMDSNLRAPFVLTQAMAAQNLKPKFDDGGEPFAAGLIVNMVDQRVRKLTPDFMTYTLAKLGLWALTQTSARALAPSIRVNAIGPGPTLQGGHQNATEFAKQRAATVLKRGSNPSDITAALGYFLDAPAVTGQLICTDGGQHLGWETPDVIGVE
ncbi:MAG: NAD(P)-dependent dehydrogenase (short-subunit alcohol dehydrogenase family) [Ascidiaceihabitans sp.]